MRGAGGHATWVSELEEERGQTMEGEGSGEKESKGVREWEC